MVAQAITAWTSLKSMNLIWPIGSAKKIEVRLTRSTKGLHTLVEIFTRISTATISLSTVHFKVAPKLSEPAINELLVKFSAGRKESGIGLFHSFLGKVSPNGF